MSEPLFKSISQMPMLETSSVKVMRSYDYCHFEICLTSNQVAVGSSAVDEMRKEAARLADKAVAQYKVMKTAMERKERVETKWLLDQAERTPEEERTPEAKACIKFHSDKNFAARFDYDYEDDYENPWCDDEDKT